MISSIIEPETINSYFKEINTSPQYTAPEQLPVPNGTRIPTFDVNTVKWFLLNQKRTAAGPDQLPHWLWKDYAHQLAPIITKIFNCSIMHQSVPALWKTANVRPIPKESPVTECTQLRPFSLTNIIMRLFERLVFKQEMSTEFKSIINNDQFGFRDGCNTTLALLKCQHFWLSALDRDSDFVRVLSFDFSKGIKRKSWLKLLGVTFQEDVTNWDIHIDNMLSKASSRMYILRVCKSYGYSKDQLNNLFNSLVMSVFLYGIEVWGAAYQRKYLDRIDRFLKRAHRFGFVTNKTTILDLIKDRDSKLFKNVIRDDHILHDLLPPKRKRVLRERKHDFIFPRVRTERFKQSFLNRCIFY